MIEPLGIELIERFHPGDDTFVAQMSLPPDEANVVCVQLGIPWRFQRQS